MSNTGNTLVGQGARRRIFFGDIRSGKQLEEGECATSPREKNEGDGGLFQLRILHVYNSHVHISVR